MLQKVSRFIQINATPYHKKNTDRMHWKVKVIKASIKL